MLQTNAFIDSDEIVFATHLQVRIKLEKNMFIASDERFLCWGRTHLALKMYAFNAGDDTFSAGNESVENARSSFSHTHTHKHTHTHTHTQTLTASYQRLPSVIYIKIIAIVTVTCTYLQNGSLKLRRSKMYLDAQRRLRLHSIGLQGQLTRQKTIA